MRKAKMFLIFPALLMVVLAGCSEKQIYYTGEKISQEEIERYSESILIQESKPFDDTETENPDDPTDEQTVNTLEIDTKYSGLDPIIDTQIYYWTAGGTKYHVYRDCGYLSNSDNVFSGTLEEGKAAGKSGLCKTCEKKLNNN